MFADGTPYTGASRTPELELPTNAGACFNKLRKYSKRIDGRMRNRGCPSSRRIASRITSEPVSLLGYSTTKFRPDRSTAETTAAILARRSTTSVVTGWYSRIAYSPNGTSYRTFTSSAQGSDSDN